MDYLHDAFISFAWKDLPRARRLHEALTRRGYVTWYAEKDMRAGDDIPDALANGLEHSRFVFVIHSIHYRGAPWAKRELNVATQDEVGSGKTKIVLLRYDDAELPYGVRHKLYIDFCDRKSRPLDKLAALLDEASEGVVRGTATAMIAADDINDIRSCAHRLSSIARLRGELLVVRELGKILLHQPASRHVKDSASWALGDIGVWDIAEDFASEIRSIVEQSIATGDARLVDGMAYIAGEMAMSARNGQLRSWAEDLIGRHERCADPAVRTPFEYTRARIASLQPAPGNR